MNVEEWKQECLDILVTDNVDIKNIINKHQINLIQDVENVYYNSTSKLKDKIKMYEDKICELASRILELQEEKNNWNKVSYTRLLDKQLTEKKNLVEILESRVENLNRENIKLKDIIKNENITNTIENEENFKIKIQQLEKENLELTNKLMSQTQLFNTISDKIKELTTENKELKEKFNQYSIFNDELLKTNNNIQYNIQYKENKKNNEDNLDNLDNTEVEEIQPELNNKNEKDNLDNTEVEEIQPELNNKNEKDNLENTENTEVEEIQQELNKTEDEDNLENTENTEVEEIQQELNNTNDEDNLENTEVEEIQQELNKINNEDNLENEKKEEELEQEYLYEIYVRTNKKTKETIRYYKIKNEKDVILLYHINDDYTKGTKAGQLKIQKDGTEKAFYIKKK